MGHCGVLSGGYGVLLCSYVVGQYGGSIGVLWGNFRGI